MSEPAGERTVTDQSGKRILVVEEEAIIALIEDDTLTEAGCAVVGPARTFEEARRLIATEQIDAAVVDGTIGGVPAYELADALRRRNIPFVVATAGTLYRPRGIPVHEFRDADFLDKPFTAQQLIDAVAALLDRRTAAS